MDKSGIYKITCLSNSKIYVGSSVSIQSRFQSHRWHLKNRCHHNPILQASYNKYGSDVFVYEVLELCEKNILVDREQYWLNYYNSSNSGFNVIPRADRKELSEDTKKKISLSLKGRKKSDKTIDRMREAQRNRTEEWKKKWKEAITISNKLEIRRKKISDALKGRPLSEETKKKLSKVHKLRIRKRGYKISSEASARLSEQRKGRPIKANYKRCMCVETGQIFESLQAAGKHFKLSNSQISNSITRNHKCHGLTFKFL